MNRFKSKKAIWWGIGVVALLIGIFTYGTLAPHVVEPYGSDHPDIHTPSMRNVPKNPGALDLEVPEPEGQRGQPKK